MIRKLTVTFAVAVAIPFALAACGDDDSESESASSGETTAAETTTEAESTTAGGGGGGGETVEISETEFAIEPADVSVKAGTVTFSVTNDGQQAHDLEVEGNGVEEVTETLDPGASGELTVDLEPGTYKMYCTIDGHEGLGMVGEVTAQ